VSFLTNNLFRPSLIFAGKAGVYLSGLRSKVHNLFYRYKTSLEVTNTLAYFGTKVVKSFIVQTLGICFPEAN
jgi:hypothetical protein